MLIVLEILFTLPVNYRPGHRHVYQLSLLCVSPDEVYFCGEYGTIFRGSKDGWVRIDDVDVDFWSLEKYQDKILVAGAEEGIFSIEEETLVPFNENVEVTGLQVIGETLFAYDINVVHKFDGKNWTKTEYDFERIIPHS